ncbi:hypothetical protein NQ317_003505 [Molorchus minor]|uniref:Complex 1 LYR protein domain-containing protein n=1 Tax=Molorchus minor TaxID=1323400 RepID=A0ABQ9K1U3_9CUCU|nr:hypothetical protein NQ317_003505 [Molorchus minor]
MTINIPGESGNLKIVLKIIRSTLFSLFNSELLLLMTSAPSYSGPQHSTESTCHKGVGCYIWARTGPKAMIFFRQRLHTAFLKNKNENDPQKIEKLISHGQYVAKEIETLYMLKKIQNSEEKILHGAAKYITDFESIINIPIMFYYFRGRSLSVCHCAIGLRGDANISDQCLSSVPLALYPKTALPIGSEVPILS